MGKNTKPMLTVLVEGDKLQQFRDYALSKEVSMGWVVNRLLDRLLSGELDVMGDSPSIGATRENIEGVSTGLTREDVESMIKSSILNLNIPSIDSSAIEELARVSIEIALEPIKESVSELETYTRSQFAAVRDELRVSRGDNRATDAVAVPAKSLETGEPISFTQLAKDLGYTIPDGVKATNPRKEGADGLIAFAATLGQSYVWLGKKQKFYRNDAN